MKTIWEKGQQNLCFSPTEYSYNKNIYVGKHQSFQSKKLLKKNHRPNVTCRIRQVMANLPVRGII